MATVLTKPVILDETGQNIANKIETTNQALVNKMETTNQELVDTLNEIKEAITISGDFTPVQIKITSQPTKKTYISGEELDLTGMVVTLIASNGITYDVTASCTTLPVEGTPITQDTDVVVSFLWQRDNITFTATQKVFLKALESIAITTPPSYTDFYVGEELDLDGIVVTATYKGGVTEDVTNDCTFNPAIGTVLTATDTEVVITYTEGSITKTTSQEISVVPIYGAEWDGTASSTWARTDAAQNFVDPVAAINNGNGSSPFDNILPWSGMVRVEDDEAGTLVAIPKYWYRWVRDGAKMKLQISNKKLKGFLTSPAHADRSDGKGERDIVYVGAYKCTGDDYKSRTGYVPKGPSNIITARTAIHELGDTIWQYDFAMYWTICMLYLVEYADWNCQKVIGYGAGSGTTSNLENTGFTDSMQYHTGTNASTRTQVVTKPSDTQATDRGHVRYRYIEDLWANGLDTCDGVYFISADNITSMYCIKNPELFGNSGGTLISELPSGSGLPTAWTNPAVEGFEYALFPSAFNPSSETSAYTPYTTYVCDNSHVPDDTYIAFGGWNSSAQYNIPLSFGLFYAYASDDCYAAQTFAKRLMKLP